MAKASWKACSMSGAHTPSASLPTSSEFSPCCRQEKGVNQQLTLTVASVNMQAGCTAGATAVHPLLQMVP